MRKYWLENFTLTRFQMNIYNLYYLTLYIYIWTSIDRYKQHYMCKMHLQYLHIMLVLYTNTKDVTVHSIYTATVQEILYVYVVSV